MNDIDQIEFGFQYFGDLTRDSRGELISHAEAIRTTVQLAVLADEIGIAAIGLGEHHRSEFSISSPETVLAGIATSTKNIRLGSAVTVLSTDDPVRVFQRFATVDALSNGRAEAFLGRGSYTESYPLFGYDLADYEVLFEEKINLFSMLRKEQPVTWSGTTRPSLDNVQVYPKTDAGDLRTWVGVGGSPQSVIRAARYGFRLMLAIIGGPPARFSRYIDLYKQAAEQFGTVAHPVGIHSPGLVADTDEQAKEVLFEHYKADHDRLAVERGWQPMQRSDFEAEIARGSLYVGSPETVARKIAHAIRALGVGRFDLPMGTAIPTSALMRSVELYGTRVIPLVKDMLSSRVIKEGKAS